MTMIPATMKDILTYRSLLADIHRGKSSRHLRTTYGVDIQRNHAVLDRAKNAEAVLQSLDGTLLEQVMDLQEVFYERYDLRRLKGLRNWEQIDDQLTATRVSLRTRFGRDQYASLVERAHVTYMAGPSYTLCVEDPPEHDIFHESPDTLPQHRFVDLPVPEHARIRYVEPPKPEPQKSRTLRFFDARAGSEGWTTKSLPLEFSKPQASLWRKARGAVAVGAVSLACIVAGVVGTVHAAPTGRSIHAYFNGNSPLDLSIHDDGSSSGGSGREDTTTVVDYGIQEHTVRMSPSMRADIASVGHDLHDGVVLVDHRTRVVVNDVIPPGLMDTFRGAGPDTIVYTDYAPCREMAMHPVAPVDGESRRYECVDISRIVTRMPGASSVVQKPVAAAERYEVRPFVLEGDNGSFTLELEPFNPDGAAL